MVDQTFLSSYHDNETLFLLVFFFFFGGGVLFLDLFSFTLRWELKLYTPLPDTNMNSYFIIPTTLSLDYGVNHKVKLACAFYCKGPHGKDSWSREA